VRTLSRRISAPRQQDDCKEPRCRVCSHIFAEERWRSRQRSQRDYPSDSGCQLSHRKPCLPLQGTSCSRTQRRLAYSPLNKQDIGVKESEQSVQSDNLDATIEADEAAVKQSYKTLATVIESLEARLKVKKR